MWAWRCEPPISPIHINIVFISQIFAMVPFVIGGLDSLLPQSQSMPNGSREVQQRMPEPDAESTPYSTISRRFILGDLCEAVSAFHSLIHRSGTISRGSSLNAGPSQLFGAITMPPFISAPSHPPHQLYELFAIIAWPHRRIR